MKQTTINNISLTISLIGFLIMLTGFWNENIRWYLFGIGFVIMLIPIIFFYKDLNDSGVEEGVVNDLS